MAITELVLGATRAAQLVLSVIALGLSSGGIHSLTRGNIGAIAPNRYSLFTTLFGLLTVLFLVTSQFLFVHQYNGYNVYITTGVVLECLNWLFTFASWIALAQYGNSPNCDPPSHYRSAFGKTCGLDKALLAFLIMLWFTWSLSLVIMARLKLNESLEQKGTKEIEMRIKNAVEQSGHATQRGDGEVTNRAEQEKQ